MKLLKSPNNWSCLLYSAAMVMDVEPKTITDWLGHDGSERVGKYWRGFHLQEIFRFAWLYMGHAHFTPVERIAATQTPDGIDFIINQEEYWETALDLWDGILVGVSPRGIGHAVAWNHRTGRCHDPVGVKADLSDDIIKPRCFWRYHR